MISTTSKLQEKSFAIIVKGQQEFVAPSLIFSTCRRWLNFFLIFFVSNDSEGVFGNNEFFIGGNNHYLHF